jgi:hypothetical protein
MTEIKIRIARSEVPAWLYKPFQMFKAMTAKRSDD